MAYRSSTVFTTMAGLTAPPGTIASDILILCVLENQGTRPIICPGWSLILENPTPNQVVGGAMYWALGNVASFSFTEPLGQPVGAQEGIIMAFSGRNLVSPVSTTPAIAFNTDSTSVTNAPTVYANTGDDLILFQTGAGTWGSVAGNPPLTEVCNTTDGLGLICIVDYANNLPAGTTTVYSRTTGPYAGRLSNVVTLAAVQNTTLGSRPGATNSGVVVSHLAEDSPTTNYKGYGNGTVSSTAIGARRHLLVQVPGVSTLTAGGIVSGVRLTLNSYAVPAAGNIDWFQVLTAIDPDTVTWNLASTGVPWATAGGLNATNVNMTPVVTMPAGVAGDMNVSGAALDALVQSWINTPSTNKGLLAAHNPDTSYDGYIAYCNTNNSSGVTLSFNYTVIGSTGQPITTQARFSSRNMHFYGSRK